MYDSQLTRWNAKQMGPKRDVIGELAEAVRGEGMKFGISNHRIENWDFMYPLSMSKDSTDLFLPEYADLYGPPQKPTEQSGMGPKAMVTAVDGGATEAVINEAAVEGRHPQSDAFLNEWQLRSMEIIDKYQPDLIYFDNGIKSPQKAVRLKNGNIIVNDWYSEWSKTPLDTLNAPIQAIEIDKTGKVVWQLCAWKDPSLGPSTTIQPLEQAVNRDRLYFGHFNGRSPKQMLGVAKWDGRTGLWVEDRWNDQQKASAMVTEAVIQLSGEGTAPKAWKALFMHFNKEHGKKGNRGYKKGEKIVIKLNLNNALTHRDTIELNSSPFTTLTLVRSLIRDGGVREQDIVLCEPSRAITDSIYNKVHREFPGVRFIDNIGGDGREKCEYYPEQIVYSQDNGKMARGLAKCIVDADYLINSALLKTHVGPGVTLTSKNWYGATDIALQWRKNAHDNFSQDKRNGKPGYKTFVDWMAHKDMGGKTLLFLIDGTYGSRDVNGAPAPKWQKAPFNNDWCCSIIVSQDEVACDAVGMDLIISEWPEYNSLNYCDEYLLEAASIPNTHSGTVYVQNGKSLNKSLGLMEHCDKKRKYKRLELIYKKL